MALLELWVVISIILAVVSLITAAIYWTDSHPITYLYEWRWFTLWVTGPVWVWLWPVLLPLALLAAMGYGVYMAFFNKEVGR